MSEFVTEEAFEERLRKAISVAWHVFARKVGGGLIPINKEASMQLARNQNSHRNEVLSHLHGIW
jgi:hypothetical protein